jgi:hypothetical protein
MDLRKSIADLKTELEKVMNRTIDVWEAMATEIHERRVKNAMDRGILVVAPNARLEGKIQAGGSLADDLRADAWLQ